VAGSRRGELETEHRAFADLAFAAEAAAVELGGALCDREPGSDVAVIFGAAHAAMTFTSIFITGVSFSF